MGLCTGLIFCVISEVDNLEEMPRHKVTSTKVFDFPGEGETSFRNVRNRQHLIRLLRQSPSVPSVEQKGIAEIWKFYRIKANIRHANQEYMYAECTDPICGACLRYKKIGNEQFQMVKILRNHCHRVTEQSIGSRVMEFLGNNRGRLEQKLLKKIAKETFNITDLMFYYYLKKVGVVHAGLKQLLVSLKGQGCSVDCIPSIEELGPERLPDMLIVVTEGMKEAYKKYGQFMTFDITYNLIKEVKQDVDLEGDPKELRYGLGFMLGTNNHNRITPFGIVVTNCESVDAFKYMFASFFQIMEKAPEVVISDQQITISASLRALKAEGLWHGAHLLDMFHFLRNLRSKLRNRDIYHILHRCMKVITKDEFHDSISSARTFIQNPQESKVIDEFVSQADRYCLAMSPPLFTGITISSSSAEKANDIVKQDIPYEQGYTDVLSKIMKAFEGLLQKGKTYDQNKTPYQVIFQNPQIRAIRFSVCKKVMDFFAKRYGMALSIDLIQTNQDHFTYQGRAEKYEIKYTRKSDKWSCTCQQSQKTGLPCVHQIKICLKKKEDLMKYIHARWLVSPQQNKGQLTDKQEKLPKIVQKSKIRKEKPKLTMFNDVEFEEI